MTSARAAARPDTVSTIAEVRSRLESAFGRVVELDTTRGPNHYILGDFDGDGRRDLAALARIRAGTAPLPRGVEAYNTFGTGMAPSEVPSAEEAVRAAAGEEVEVVIHRLDQPATASRRFILLFPLWRGARMDRFRDTIPLAIAGDEPEPIPPPRLRGDAILLHGGGDGAVLYWDGERYRWYPYGPAQAQ